MVMTNIIVYYYWLTIHCYSHYSLLLTIPRSFQLFPDLLFHSIIPIPFVGLFNCYSMMIIQFIQLFNSNWLFNSLMMMTDIQLLIFNYYSIIPIFNDQIPFPVFQWCVVFIVIYSQWLLCVPELFIIIHLFQCTIIQLIFNCPMTIQFYSMIFQLFRLFQC